MSNRKKRRQWSDEEKREICQQAILPGTSVAQIARRYCANANMIHNWLKDPRFAPNSEDLSMPTDAFFIALDVSAAAPTQFRILLPHLPQVFPQTRLILQRAWETTADACSAQFSLSGQQSISSVTQVHMRLVTPCVIGQFEAEG